MSHLISLECDCNDCYLAFGFCVERRLRGAGKIWNSNQTSEIAELLWRAANLTNGCDLLVHNQFGLGPWLVKFERPNCVLGYEPYWLSAYVCGYS